MSYAFTLSSALSTPESIAYKIVFILADVAAPVGGTAVAIVLFTIAVRLLLAPLTVARFRGDRRRAALAPKIAELRRQHGSDAHRLQAETFALYRAEGGAAFGGCLPALLQAPFFFVTYRLFVSPAINGKPNALLAGQLLGTPLGAHAFGGFSLAFLCLFAVLAGLAWLSSRRYGRSASDAGPAAGPLLRLMPYLTLVTAAIMPLAAGLYLATSTAWTALEGALLPRLVDGSRDG